MIGSDVQNYANIRVIKTETRTNDAASGGLEYCDVDGGILQHELRRNRTGVVALNYLFVAYVCTVCRSKTNGAARVSKNVRYQTSRRRLAVGSRDRKDRDP